MKCAIVQGHCSGAAEPTCRQPGIVLALPIQRADGCCLRNDEGRRARDDTSGKLHSTQGPSQHGCNGALEMIVEQVMMRLQ